MNRGSSSGKQNGTRTLLGKQPARSLLVDAWPPLSDEVTSDLCDSLENMLSVACNISGPSRMPLFSLLVLSSYPELLHPLSYVKNNFPRLQQACTDLRSTIDEARCQSVPGDGDCVVQGLQEACAQFQRQNSNTTQRIQLVSLSNLGSDSIADDKSDDCASQSSSSSSSSGLSGLVDVIKLDTDPLCLQNFFSSWLIDSSTDSEHLHIVLPPGLTDTTDIIIQCDLHERMINPTQLPFQGQFTLHPDSVMMKTFPTTSKALGISLPIFRIHVIGLMNASAMCDSIVFGMPMIAQPTACWKIDWDDLEKNQQIFRCLVHLLLEKEKVMIGQLENVLPNTSTKRPHGQAEDKPLGCFVFLPAENGTLLVKSVASQELLLPFQIPAMVDNCSEESIQTMESSLSKLELIDVFNPLLWPCRLYECLKSKLKKADPKQSKKRQDSMSHSGSVQPSAGVPSAQRNKTFVLSSAVSGPRCTTTGVMHSNTDRVQHRFQGKPLLPFPTDL
ncbi:meiosis 1 arrest protein-like isoform X2 [Argopecten irradians]|uniref:meiosis 1 arrest protein-like isoform X2 n=1 Tax=Argopecten irradians TaxID=31199 RepID=UPI00372491A8